MKSLLWLCSLLPLLSAVNAALNEPPGPVSPDIDPCTIKAWVRAPDLDPGKIIPGQVRIRATGSCDPITEYSLILRFKERVWVKVVKPDAILPEKPPRYLPRNASMIERNSVFGSRFRGLNENPIWQEYTNELRNQTLWTVSEEERVAFESRYKLFDGATPEDHLILDFALLIPTTNYPPSERILSHTISGEPTSSAERGNEHIYIYTVETKFLNGTTIEIPAGYSAFNTLGPSPQVQDNKPEVVTFRANFTERSFSSPSNPLNFSFDVNVTFPHGRTLEQGTNHSLTFTLWDDSRPTDDGHKNYNIIFTPPQTKLRVSSEGRRMQTLSLGKNISIPLAAEPTRCQLSPTLKNGGWGWCGSLWENGVGEWNMTTSQPLNIVPAAFPSFNMYYQSLEPELHIMLSVRLENLDEDEVFDEEYYWTPVTNQHSKKRKVFRSFHTKIPITVHPKPKQDFHVTHYLSPDARQPVFVDPSTTSELLKLSVEERDLLAPKSIPSFKEITDDIVQQRYYSHSLHYVGDTWLRKVVNGGSKVVQEGNGIEIHSLLVQVG